MTQKKQPGPEYLLPMKWVVALFKAITFDEGREPRTVSR